MDKATVDELAAWDAKRIEERERRETEIFDTLNNMTAKASDPSNRDEVLAWCRQRIDIPPAKPHPVGSVRVSDLKQWAIDDDDRRLKEIDARYRADLEKHLTTRDDGELH